MSAPQLRERAIGINHLVGPHTPWLKEQHPHLLRKREKLDKSYWGDRRPKEVVFATASIQKMMKVLQQEYGVSLPPNMSIKSGTPLEVQSFLTRNVKNHNGASGGKIFLGYFEGVPFFAEPSQESPDDDSPVSEAVMKVQTLAKKYDGQNILILGADTTDKVTTRFANGAEETFWLGKPMNQEKFKQVVDSIGLREAATLYLMHHYFRENAAQTTITNVNGVAALNTKTGKLVTDEVHLHVPVQANEVARLDDYVATFDPGAGGSGFTQRQVDWDSPDLLKTIGDQRVQEKLAGQSRETIMWALYCQMTGVPWWVMLESIAKITDRQPRALNSTVIYKAA